MSRALMTERGDLVAWLMSSIARDPYACLEPPLWGFTPLPGPVAVAEPLDRLADHHALDGALDDNHDGLPSHGLNGSGLYPVSVTCGECAFRHRIALAPSTSSHLPRHPAERRIERVSRGARHALRVVRNGVRRHGG